MREIVFAPALTSSIQLWVTLLLAGFLTYGIRLSFILFFGRIEIPEWLMRALRYVPPAVLSAIILPELLIHQGELNLSLDNARLLAGLISIFVAWRTRSAALTVLIGMLALWFLQWLL